MIPPLLLKGMKVSFVETWFLVAMVFFWKEEKDLIILFSEIMGKGKRHALPQKNGNGKPRNKSDEFLFYTVSLCNLCQVER